MSSAMDSFFLFLLPQISSPSINQLQLLTLVILLLAALSSLWLFPGGLGWAVIKPRVKNPIPGPTGLPVFGLLFTFTGPSAHRALAKLARSFEATRLMAFSVGSTRFVISSQPDTAKEILNSSAFADRPVKESAYELLFHRAMGFAPFGGYWRHLRRISSTHLFNPKRVAAFGAVRGEIGLEMVDQIRVVMAEEGVIEARRVLHFGSLNNVMMCVLGKRYDFNGGMEGGVVEGLVKEGYELLGTFNWSDHFPLIGWLDLQGVRKRSREMVVRVKEYVGEIIVQHRKRRDEGCGEDDGERDFVDVLLELEKEDQLSDSDMIAVLWEMIFRGTDTVAILLEWALARMVLHPLIQSKVQSEIDSVVGNYRIVSDADIPNLPYLRSVVKEALRMHPPGPLLSWARLAIHDVHVGHAFIPSGTTAMVNMWAITHDEKIWSEPEKFKPERFMEEEDDVSVMGSDLRLAPFGSGRRVCPGKSMGLANVHLWLALMLQRFQWVPSEKGVDLSECLKMSLEMKNPLVCKALPRL